MSLLHAGLRNRSGWRIVWCASVGWPSSSARPWPILTGTSGPQTVPRVTWIRHSGFQDFSKGSFADSGAKSLRLSHWQGRDDQSLGSQP